MNAPKKLNSQEIEERKAALEEWQVVDGHHLVRLYKFPDFALGLAFVNRVGAIAEKMNHHPDLLLKWGSVEMTVWTHSVNGLTENDFKLAAEADRACQT